MGMRVSWRGVWALGLLCLIGCGDDSDLAGGAGMTAIPTVGEPCTNQCDSGFICGRGGPLDGVCTAGCNSAAACGLLAPGTDCLPDPVLQCARPCTTTDDCATGAACVQVLGTTVCRLPPSGGTTP